MKSVPFLSLLFCSIAMFGYVEGAEFPNEVTIPYEGKELTLEKTGTATRKKLIIPVYKVAHYIQKGTKIQGSDKYQSVLQSKKAKQLTLHWVRNVEASKVDGSLKDSFEAVLSSQGYKKLEPQIKTFTSFFKKGVKKGDEQIFRWYPNGDVQILINGKEAGNIQNPSFGRALWSIYFSPKGVVKRENLVANLK